MQGPTAFGDTYGAPRAEGRSHQGVDMISPRGHRGRRRRRRPGVPRSNTLGGTTISLYGSDGNRYYYAHLDGYVALGAVVKGTVIGIVGDTGNAKQSTPHLHFEIHPGRRSSRQSVSRRWPPTADVPRLHGGRSQAPHRDFYGSTKGHLCSMC